jgi:hypothetical protein
MALCVIARFKNERHIMYEFINHYLLEGVDCFILIDDNSDDNYLEFNKSWLNELIQSNKVIIKNAKTTQRLEYNLYLQEIKLFEWVIVCDMDEFFFSVSPNTTIKSLLNDKLSIYDYIKVPWKMFTHNSCYQPKSVIDNNLYTHSNTKDFTSISLGYKSIIKTKSLIQINVHFSIVTKNSKTLVLSDCHNKLIQNNHYRTQSDEYLFGVKEIRGGGIHKNKYKGFFAHKLKIYNKKCELLKNKREDLINKCLAMNQVRPKIYENSSFYKEYQNELFKN